MKNHAPRSIGIIELIDGELFLLGRPLRHDEHIEVLQDGTWFWGPCIDAGSMGTSLSSSY